MPSTHPLIWGGVSIALLWLISRYLMLALLYWLKEKHGLTVGKVGFMSVSNVVWTSTVSKAISEFIGPGDVHASFDSAGQSDHSQNAAGASPPFWRQRSSSDGLVGESAKPQPNRLIGEVRVHLSAIQLRIHWAGLRGHHAQARCGERRLFTLLVDRPEVEISIREPPGSSLPSCGEPRSPQRLSSGPLDNQWKSGGAPLRRGTEFFRAFVVSRLRTLLVGLLIYALVRWADILVTRIRIAVVYRQVVRTEDTEKGDKCQAVHFTQEYCHLSGAFVSTKIHSEHQGGNNSLPRDPSNLSEATQTLNSDEIVELTAVFSSCTLRFQRKTALRIQHRSALVCAFHSPGRTAFPARSSLSCRLPDIDLDLDELKNIQAILMLWTEFDISPAFDHSLKFSPPSSSSGSSGGAAFLPSPLSCAPPKELLTFLAKLKCLDLCDITFFVRSAKLAAQSVSSQLNDVIIRAGSVSSTSAGFGGSSPREFMVSFQAEAISVVQDTTPFLRTKQFAVNICAVIGESGFIQPGPSMPSNIQPKSTFRTQLSAQRTYLCLDQHLLSIFISDISGSPISNAATQSRAATSCDFDTGNEGPFQAFLRIALGASSTHVSRAGVHLADSGSLCPDRGLFSNHGQSAFTASATDFIGTNVQYPATLSNILTILDVECQVSLESLELELNMISAAKIVVNLAEVSVNASASSNPKLEVDGHVLLSPFTAKIVAMSRHPASEVNMQNGGDQVLALFSTDIMRVDLIGTDTTMDPVPTTSSGEQIRDLVFQVEGIFHRPRLDLDIDEGLIQTFRKIHIFLQQAAQNKTATSPPANLNRLLHRRRSFPLQKVHCRYMITAKLVLEQMVVSVISSPPSLKMAQGLMVGIRGCFDGVTICYSGRREFAAQSTVGQATPSMEIGGHMSELDEIVVDVDKLVIEEYGVDERSDTKSVNDTATPRCWQGVSVVQTQHVSIEHKAMQTLAMASKDTRPSVRRDLETRVVAEEDIVACYSLPLHLLIKHIGDCLNRLQLGLSSGRERRQRRASLTSLLKSESVSHKFTVCLHNVVFFVLLPENTKLQVLFAEAEGEMHRSENEMMTCVMSCRRVEVLSTKSHITKGRQSQATSLVSFLSHSGLLGLEFYLLLTMTCLNCKFNVDSVTISCEALVGRSPDQFYMSDVIENFSTFMKLAKTEKLTSEDSNPIMWVKILVEHAAFAVEDDNFESKLGIIFRKGKDFQLTRLEREEALSKRLASLHELDTGPFWDRLYMCHSRDWVKIMSTSTPKRDLVNVHLAGIEMVLNLPEFSAKSLVETCHSLDDTTPPDALFDFTFARDFHLWTRSVSIDLRDYPLSLLQLPCSDITNMRHSLSGLIILAEPVAPMSAHCLSSVNLMAFGVPHKLDLERILAPLKMYINLVWDIESPLSIHWGPSMEPALANLSLVFDKFTNPSIDPSDPMPWWDKMRWLVHGQFLLQGDVVNFHHVCSRNPYFSRLIADGSEGILLTGRNSVQIAFSGTKGMILKCRDFKIQKVEPRITLNFLKGVPSSETLWGSDPFQKKDDVMVLSGGVVLEIHPVFECTARIPNHHSVFPVAPEHIVSKDHDSYETFRSVRFSLAIRIHCDNSDTYNCFTFTPELVQYLVKFVEFNVQNRSTPIRQGNLFPLTTAAVKPKKLSLFLSRASLRVELSPLLLTLWHKDKTILFPNEAVGLRAVSTRCSIDFHCARHREHENRSCLQPWYIDTTDIEFDGIEIRTVLLSHQPNTNQAESTYFRFEAAELIKVEFANHDLVMFVHSNPFFWSPRLAYCRKSDVAYGRESTFGRDITKVQLFLLRQYLQEASSHASVVISQRIRQLESSTQYLLEQDDYLHSFVVHNARLLWDIEVRNVVFRFVDLQQRSSLLAYYLSNSSLRVLRDLEAQISSQGESHQKSSAKAGASFRAPTYLDVSTPMPQSMSPAHEKPVPGVLGKLDDGERLLNTQNDIGTTTADNGKMGLEKESMGTVAEERLKFLMIRFINPQIKFVAPKCDDSPAGNCFVSTENAVLTQYDVCRNHVSTKTETVAEIRQANFTVSTNVEAAQTIGMTAPYLADCCLDWLPLESLVSLSQRAMDDLESQGMKSRPLPVPLPPGFVQVVSRASTRLSHQKVNPAISDNNLGNATDLADERDMWQMEFNQFALQADALAYAILFSIVSKLIIYREPTKTKRQEQLDTILLAMQSDDYRVLIDSVVKLRADINTLRLALGYDTLILENGQPDVDGTVLWTDILRSRCELEDHLLVIMDAFKIISRNSKRSAFGHDASGVDNISQLPDAQDGPTHATYQTRIIASDVVWDMLLTETQTCFIQWRLYEVSFDLTDFSDLSRTFNLIIDKIAGWNRLINPVYEEVAGGFITPSNVEPEASYDSVMRQMLRVHWHELAPVAGIALVSHFAVHCAPIKFQMTYDLGKQLVNYIFPVRIRKDVPAHSVSVEGVMTTSGTCRERDSNSMSKVSLVEPPVSAALSKRKKSRDLPSLDSADALVQMKTRASRNTTFISIRVPSFPLCISYRGNKEKNIEDIHEFILTMPEIEYRNKTWTWLEFMTQVRKDIFFAILGHTGQLVREKLFSTRRGPSATISHGNDQSDGSGRSFGSGGHAPTKLTSSEFLNHEVTSVSLRSSGQSMNRSIITSPIEAGCSGSQGHSRAQSEDTSPDQRMRKSSHAKILGQLWQGIKKSKSQTNVEEQSRETNA